MKAYILYEISDFHPTMRHRRNIVKRRLKKSDIPKIGETVFATSGEAKIVYELNKK